MSPPPGYAPEWAKGRKNGRAISYELDSYILHHIAILFLRKEKEIHIILSSAPSAVSSYIPNIRLKILICVHLREKY